MYIFVCVGLYVLMRVDAYRYVWAYMCVYGYAFCACASMYICICVNLILRMYVSIC